MEFRGCYTALATPFKEDGAIDYDAYGALIEWQIEQGISGLVPCGCTGEAATMSHEEQRKTISFAVDVVKKRVPVVAGTGSNATAEAVALTEYAASAGADAALLITPYYNKPTPEGQYEHYKAVAEAVSIPIMLYNVPSRTGISILPETVARLSGIDNIQVIKEASGSLDQVSQIKGQCDIQIMSGDDSLTLPMLTAGATGVVSVASNIIPKEMTALVDDFAGGSVAAAMEAHTKYFDLFKALFLETNPLPVKAALAAMGKMRELYRLPLVPMTPANKTALMDVLKRYNVI